MVSSMRLLKLAAAAAVVALVPFASPVIAEPDQGQVTTALFNEILGQVRNNYVEPVSDSHLLEGAIKGMLASLDPHSSYLDAKEYKEMMVQTRGEFGGLGMQVTMENGLLKVVSPIDDTPAARAGMKPGDLIVAIDGASVADMTLSDAVDRMRGPIGTQIALTVRRQGKDPFEVKLTRADIKVDAVKSRLEGNDIAYVRITSFSERAGSGVEQAIQSLKEKANGKLAGVVLDLRNNPGGLLDQAVAVANEFLDGGEIVSMKGRQPQDDRRFDAQPNRDLVPGLPVIVLINGGSASASEIVAGALQDNHRAVLLGTRSFGKGSVQTILPVRQSGGALRLTTARYYTPSGRSIQAKGIEPDVVVEPAKIEKVALTGTQREASLHGALKNTGPEEASANGAAGAAAMAPAAPTTAPAAAPTATPAVAPTTAPPNVPPGTTPAARPQAGLDPNLIGSDADYQLVRAIDLLRGVTLFKKLAAE
jgi:carboxyl-terminal processing protease